MTEADHSFYDKISRDEIRNGVQHSHEILRQNTRFQSKSSPVLTQGEGGALVPLFSASCILKAESENPGGCNLKSWHITVTSHRAGRTLAMQFYTQNLQLTLRVLAKSIKYSFLFF